jgi:hypothetical protein
VDDRAGLGAEDDALDLAPVTQPAEGSDRHL